MAQISVETRALGPERSQSEWIRILARIGIVNLTKAAGICNISAELLKAGGEAMIRGLHAVLTAVWHSGTIPPDWKKGLVVPIWKGNGDRQD